MNLIELEDRGFYEPGFLHLRVNTNKSLSDLTELYNTDRSLFSTFLHEYIHFLQEVTTTSGLTNAAFYINTIKEVNHTVINDGKTEFEVPFKFNNDNNTLAQIELKLAYIGEKHDANYARYDGFIEEVREIIDCDGKILNVRQYKVYYYDSSRNPHNFYFGQTCLKEYVAHSIQTKFFSEIQHPDVPYAIAGLILDHECPSLGSNSDFYIVLCDACLMSYHPAQLFFNTIQRIKEDNFIPKTAKELYDYTLNLNFDDNGTLHDPESMFDIAKDTVIGHLENALQAEYFLSNLNWIKHILDMGAKLRKGNPLYMMEILNVDGNLSTLFFQIFRKLGTPYFTNDLYDGGIVPPEDILKHPDQPYQLLAFREILNTFQGQQNCGLYDLCNKPESDVETDNNCKAAPWKRATYERLCPYGQMWKSWALTNEIPVKKK